jgi:hypothetical protein
MVVADWINSHPRSEQQQARQLLPHLALLLSCCGILVAPHSELGKCGRLGQVRAVLCVLLLFLMFTSLHC